LPAEPQKGADMCSVCCLRSKLTDRQQQYTNQRLTLLMRAVTQCGCCSWWLLLTTPRLLCLPRLPNPFCVNGRAALSSPCTQFATLEHCACHSWHLRDKIIFIDTAHLNNLLLVSTRLPGPRVNHDTAATIISTLCSPSFVH